MALRVVRRRSAASSGVRSPATLCCSRGRCNRTGEWTGGIGENGPTRSHNASESSAAAIAAHVIEPPRVDSLIVERAGEALLCALRSQFPVHAAQPHEPPAPTLAVRGESRALHRDERGASRARRDDREYRLYLMEDQRRPRGCIARRMQTDFHHGLLAHAPRSYLV